MRIHYQGENVIFIPSNISLIDSRAYKFEWTFDYYTIKIGYKVSYIWNTTGVKNITLKVTDLLTGKISSSTNQINIILRNSMAEAPPIYYAPTITMQPTSVTVAAPIGASFAVAASGTAPLTYQWYNRSYGTTTWNKIGSATSSTYNISPTTYTGVVKEYYCLVKNSFGTAASNIATLTVTLNDPVITSQPSNSSVTTPSSGSFSVTATCASTLYYQWYKSIDGGDVWTIIQGAVSRIYTTPATVVDDNNSRYRCVITNAASSSVTSNYGILYVTAHDLYMNISANNQNGTTIIHSVAQSPIVNNSGINDFGYEEGGPYLMVNTTEVYGMACQIYLTGHAYYGVGDITWSHTEDFNDCSAVVERSENNITITIPSMTEAGKRCSISLRAEDSYGTGRIVTQVHHICMYESLQ